MLLVKIEKLYFVNTRKSNRYSGNHRQAEAIFPMLLRYAVRTWEIPDIYVYGGTFDILPLWKHYVCVVQMQWGAI